MQAPNCFDITLTDVDQRVKTNFVGHFTSIYKE